MAKAFHIIGLSDGDLGRLGRPTVDHTAIFTRARARFDAIRESGVLRPAGPAFLHNIPNEPTRQYLEDVWAGDNEYVFLSIGRRYDNIEPGATFGFMFDAAKLVDLGAVVRDHDLLSEYEDIMSECISEFAPFRDVAEWSPDEMARLTAAIENPDATDADNAGPNDAYYNLERSVRESDWSYPNATLVRDNFIRRVKELQVVTQHRDAAALLRIAADPESGVLELLTRGDLPLRWATGYIIAGEEVAR